MGRGGWGEGTAHFSSRVRAGKGSRLERGPPSAPRPGGRLLGDRGFSSDRGGTHFHPKVTGSALRLGAS